MQSKAIVGRVKFSFIKLENILLFLPDLKMQVSVVKLWFTGVKVCKM